MNKIVIVTSLSIAIIACLYPIHAKKTHFTNAIQEINSTLTLALIIQRAHQNITVSIGALEGALGQCPHDTALALNLYQAQCSRLRLENNALQIFALSRAHAERLTPSTAQEEQELDAITQQLTASFAFLQ